MVVFALNAGLVGEEEAHAGHLGRTSEENCERGIGVEFGVSLLDRVDAVVEDEVSMRVKRLKYRAAAMMRSTSTASVSPTGASWLRSPESAAPDHVHPWALGYWV
jgi:hypothetical protein